MIRKSVSVVPVLYSNKIALLMITSLFKQSTSYLLYSSENSVQHKCYTINEWIHGLMIFLQDKDSSSGALQA